MKKLIITTIILLSISYVYSQESERNNASFSLGDGISFSFNEGDYELKSILVSDAAKKESQEIINDLIIAAYNNAKENLKKKSAEELSKVTGGLNLPLDFKLPF